ncbi:helix-turn-helix domain-containing protein [Ditylenchus destructor]|uniref:Helix-turn-helix domain-containing protein n=1 Tax=Ditylenchus destructor TaxID=166010 RepID=A0AAD4MER5_9BILA|nr:helix-turn-helix domain-containing protein [Ditylenchus destructor]
MAICHLVLQGECWAQVDGGEPIRAHAGEVIAAPHGDSHVLGSGLHHAAVDMSHMVSPRAPELERVRYGGEGDRTLLVCSWFAYEGDAPIPSWRTFRACSPRSCEAGRRARDRAVRQLRAGRCGFAIAGFRDGRRQGGGGAVSPRCLRGYIESMPPTTRAGSRACGPPREPLPGADACRPARNWTVDALAHETHTSRSVLADRFAELVGVPPMHYLARWRMILAAGMLRRDQCNLARIAEGVGYESEAAFNRAFKREYGVSPGAWRHNGA